MIHMKNVLVPPKLKAQQSRNGFDLGYQNQFTAPFGAIIPCGFWRVNPNDSIKLANESQVVCDGLVRPAFMRLKEHIDYYFIPATQLWMPFDNFVTGQDSYFSSSVQSVQSSRVPTQVPNFTGQFLCNLVEHFEQSTTLDELGYPILTGVIRMLDMLGYCNLWSQYFHQTISTQEFQEVANLPSMNFFRALCYQKVYFDYFRNSMYEDNNVKAYNIDDLDGDVVNDAYDTRFDDCFRLRYRWTKKDYFTQVRPNVMANPNLLGFSGLSSYAQDLSNKGVFGVPGAFGNGTGSTTRTSSATTQIVDNNDGQATMIGTFAPSGGTRQSSVANIRFAFAYDKLLRRMREAGQDFDKQMLAQFGIAPIDTRHGKCTYIGGFTNSLKSSDVTNMTGANIGELAGQINTYSQNVQRPLKFHAKEHGFVIAVWSTSCENTYQSYKLDRDNACLNRFDWFNPVYENLGLQPIFRFEMDYTNPAVALNSRGGTFWGSDKLKQILGYVPRYSEYKTKVDEVHSTLCRFSDTSPMDAWNMQYFRKKWSNGIVLANAALTMSDLLLDPAMMDNVSSVVYDGSSRNDHFVVNMYHHNHTVSSMSANGEIF